MAIRIAKPPRVVHTDEITQAQTTHYTLEIDVPSAAVSFDEAERVRKRKNAAFFRHRKNGRFILAVESGLHTNAETGNSYRTFAVWKPEAARSSYIHSDELTEKYTAVTPAKARNWWTDKYTSVPPIETHEIHIIGGAIIPLWQRFKTHEEARLRVVRVTTDDGQRIVGIRIPREQVGPIVRALGAGRDLREPGDVFSGILDEGEEVTLVSGLKLCRRTLHREPVIELIGVDPYKFAEIRSLGLLNEQIDWKQRFFVPTDEESGVNAISVLLDRYPILISSESDHVELAEPEIVAELRATQVVDLNEWFVPVERFSTPRPEPRAELAVTAPEPVHPPEFFLTCALTNSLSIPQQTRAKCNWPLISETAFGMAAAFSNLTESDAPLNEDALQNPALVRESSRVFLPDGDSVELTGSRLLTFEAMHLLISLDRDLREARAQWNQDWFRRLMRIRPKAVSPLRRRWAKLDTPPAIPLGALRRRYHANLARYLYPFR